jgi:hypothetical protein
MALASLALTACHTKDWYENDGIPIEPEPEPVITYEGSGRLVRDDVNGNIAETNHTYSWKADETTISVVVNVDGSQYVNGDDNFAGGAFCAGWFTLDRLSINDFLGCDVKTDLNETNFYAVNPDGSKVDAMTSYKPGMWVDATGASCGWGDGRMFWQWYVWGDEDGGGYDMNANDYPDILYIGSNPGNVKDVLGKTVVSKAKIEVGGTTYDWIITVNYSEAEKMVTGEGKLSYHNWTSDVAYEIVETTSKYSYVLHETEGLEVNVEVNTEEWRDSGDWEIGFIGDLTADVVSDVWGFDPGTLSDEEFYPVNPDGSKVTWSSFAPGMWIDGDGASTDYSAGIAYWQWYTKEGDRDYDYEGSEGIFLVGGNRDNIAKIEFDTPIVSTAKIVKDGKELTVTVTYIFHDVILPETEGYPEAVFEGTGTPYPYGGGVDGDHTINWYFDEEGLTVDVDAYIPSIEGWGFTATVIPPEAMKAYLGIDDIEKLFDPTYFYGINPDGSTVDYGDNHDVWSSYKPGMWVGEDGTQSGSGGVMFWQYQFGDHKYDAHFTEGLMVIGTNPGNVAGVAGKTITSRAKMGDKLLTVNVTFHGEYPTAKTGKVGPHSYSWTLGDDGVEIVAEASAAAKDGSYAWMGFFVNENYINAKYGYNLSELATDFENGFYPVANDGATKLEKWTSYIPGMWFAEDGNAGGWAFWQYYTSNYSEVGYHDFAAPGLVYVGKNPGNEYAVGAAATSKAIAGGKAFNVTLKIAE